MGELLGGVTENAEIGEAEHSTRSLDNLEEVDSLHGRKAKMKEREPLVS